MSFVPLYMRIKERIRADMLLAENQGDDGRMPTERELQIRYSVSRPTVSKALAALAAEGYLSTAQGRGRFVLAGGNGHDGAEAPRRIGYVASIATETLTQRTLCGVEHAARRRGYRVVMASASNSVDHERDAALELIASGARGLIIYPVPRPLDLPSPDYLAVEDMGVPVVLVDTPAPDHRHTQFVFDNERVGYSMTSWLLGRGHRSIGFALSDQSLCHLPLANRLRGYRAALTDHGVSYRPELVVHFDGGTAGQAEECRRIAAEWGIMVERPTAVLAAEDMAAVDLIEGFEGAGLHVPDDVQVVGFDDREEVRRSRHVFTTTQPDFERLGECACACLLDQLDGDLAPPRTYVYDVPVLVRRAAESRVAVDRGAHALVSAEEVG